MSTRSQCQKQRDALWRYLQRFRGGRCHYCGRELTRETFTREHIVPASLGGPSERWNLVAACEGCNRRRGSVLVGCLCARCRHARRRWQDDAMRPVA